MPDTVLMQPSDWQERLRALDISSSCIVQAPAGSGKTELLVQRILALLAVAEKPEEVLSITFTRKAAGEMRQRLLNALQDATYDIAPQESYAKETWTRARAVLTRDRENGWMLLQNPSRLQLMTIDSFCAYLTRRMPWMSRFGEQPGVTDDPDDLYREATENLLARLERGDSGHAAIESLLIHLDNRLPLLRDLLVTMLGKRDQWLRHLAGQRLGELRELLESALSLYVSTFLARLHSTLGEENYRELCELGIYAVSNLAGTEDDSSLLVLSNEPEDQGSLAQWRGLADLVLTQSGEVRKTVNKKNGFPADKTSLAKEMKSRMQSLLDKLRDDDDSATRLQDIRKLPETSYQDSQWITLQALIELLPLAAYELREVFRARGVVDFIEIAGAARAALGEETAPEDLLLQLDSRIRHILVDEFQDTSYAQYELLRSLTAGWEAGDGRTLFVVGDPMQSIYRFREAEVGLYLHVCENGLGGLPMERIVLNTNFRSNKSVVNWTNHSFGQLFPTKPDTLNGAVPFSPAVAYDQAETGARVSFQVFPDRQDECEAEAVVDFVRKTREEGTVAVLVRSRSHLEEIVLALKRAGITYQAQDVDPLSGRPVVRDIISLTRAIYHLADRVAWLAVLRAPWCGLPLNDLAAICGHDSNSTIWELLTNDPPQEEMFDKVSKDARVRLERVMPVLKRALANKGRLSLRNLVESTWLCIGGPACCSESELQEAEQVFVLFDRLEKGATLVDIENQLEKLFAAPAPCAKPDVQLMTIHKAKGLEFDSVILPGLGRGVRGEDRTLLRWLEHPEYELLLAPIPPLLSDERDATYDAIGHIQKTRTELETTRLLYVAATRAKTNLHLLGHVTEDSKAGFKPLAGSLMAVLWPACREEFLQNLATPGAEQTHEIQAQKIRRLAADWSLPEMPVPLHTPEFTSQIASGSHYIDEGVRSRKTEEGKVIGTIVHEYLELIAAESPQKWSPERVASEIEACRDRLCLEGVPLARTEPCIAIIKECLVNTLDSEYGRWLMASHHYSACELPVNGVVNGQLVHASIDRVLNDDGTWWVIDYKTSAPSRGQNPESFMDEETVRYQPQLQTYKSLLKRIKTTDNVRAGLYFPRFDGWREVDI